MNTLMLAVLLTSVALSSASGSDVFTPPKSYPASRYEPGWQKNPFTLKAAPPVMQKENFANDLTLAGIRQSGADTTVILANKKTREYIRLKNAEPSLTGIKVRAVHPLGKRMDTYVELDNGADTAIVRFDESFLQQMAAQNTSPMPLAQANVKMPAQPRPVLPLPGVNQPNITAGGVTAPNIIPQQPAQLKLPPLPTGAAGANTQPNIPTPQRRRINTAPKSDP